MKKFSSLYFPDTAVFSETQYPLFLLVDQLELLRFVEPSEEFISNDIFLQRGLCQAHTPLPMGDDRDRFVHLLNDIQHRKDDYAAQLGNLTITGMSESEMKDDENRTTILSSLLGERGFSSAQSDDHDSTNVWQARLLLALAEILDREEEELAGHLSFLDEQELAMFQKLQDESGEDDENPFQELLEIQQKITRPSQSMMRNRCKAWRQLYQGGSLSAPSIWTVTREDAVDHLCEAFEKAKGTAPLLCDMINMPASIGRDMPFVVDTIKTFREENSQVLTDIHTPLMNLLDHPVDGEPPERPVIGPSEESMWEEALEQYFPENLHGRKKVRVYFFQGVTIGGALTGSGEKGNGILLFMER